MRSTHWILPRITACTLLIVICTASTGCVVRDIHDEMVETSDSLAEINERLALIERTNGLLDDGNQSLADVQTRLELMEALNESLKDINASLAQLDEHLASLRATIDNVDSVIPFVDLAGDPEDIEDADEARATGASDGSDQE